MKQIFIFEKRFGRIRLLKINYCKLIIIVGLTFFYSNLSHAQNGFRLIGFSNSYHYDEQILEFNFDPEIKVHINAPSGNNFNPELKVVIALYALPNGNSTAQTIGKVMQAGDDWHFNIQFSNP